jgi:hypothetical protein
MGSIVYTPGGKAIEQSKYPVWARAAFKNRTAKNLYEQAQFDIVRQKLAAAKSVTWVDGTDVISLKDPYSLIHKRMFEASYRGDGTVSGCVDAKVRFTLGQRTKTVVDITEEFTAAETEEKQAAKSDALSTQEADKLLTAVDNIHRQVHFHEHLFAAMTQAMVGGRSAILVEKDAQRLPARLKLLNWMKLGRVFVDIKTWEFLGVEYDERTLGTKDGPLTADEIIYLPRRNYHITPDSLYYGSSDLESVVHLSETNRLIDQVDTKEIARAMWAPFTTIYVPPDTDDQTIEEIKQDFYPGTVNFTTSDIKVETHQQKVDIAGIVALRESNERRIVRNLRIPSFAAGFEEITNRATAEEVMLGWTNSELATERTWLRDTIEPQWLDPMLEIIYGDKFITDNVGEVTTQRREFKLKLEFENVELETLKDKSEALLPMYDRHLITPAKMLEMTQMADQTEEITKYMEEMQQKEEEEKAQQLQLQKEAIQVRAQSATQAFKGPRKPEMKGQMYTGVSQQKNAAVAALEAQQAEDMRKLQREEAELRIALKRKQLALSDMIESGIKKTLASGM